MVTDLATLLLDIVSATHRNDAITLGGKIREVHAREDALRAENAKLRAALVCVRDGDDPFPAIVARAALAGEEVGT